MALKLATPKQGAATELGPKSIYIMQPSTIMAKTNWRKMNPIWHLLMAGAVQAVKTVMKVILSVTSLLKLNLFELIGCRFHLKFWAKINSAKSSSKIEVILIIN